MFMKCPHCGNELKDDAKCLRQVRCRLWRKRFNLGNRKSCKCEEENLQALVFWVIIVVAIMIVGGVNGAINGNSGSNKSKQETTVANQSSEKQLKKRQKHRPQRSCNRKAY